MRPLGILLLISLLVGGVVVLADCGTDNPGDNATVTCDSIPANDTDGFDGSADTGLNVTVEEDASVSNDGTAIQTGDDADITVEEGATVDGNNLGDGIVVNGDSTIEVAQDATVSGNNGIIGNGETDLVNNGTITSEGDDAVELNSDNNSVTNNGTIEGQWGIWAPGTAGNTITNTGEINTVNHAVNVGSDNTISNTGTGTIESDLSTGISAQNDNTITNDGTVTANSNGINADNGNTITNSGTVHGEFGAGIGVNSDNTITNSGTVTSENQAGIFVNDNNDVTNNGTVEGEDGIIGDSGNVITNNGTVTGDFNGVEVEASAVVNFGSITGLDDNGIEISFGDGAYIRNEAGGVIRGNAAGIEDEGSGDDTILNYGTVIGESGTAIDAGAGNDLVALFDNSRVQGNIDGGAGSDEIVLSFDFGTISEEDADALSDAIDRAMRTTERNGSGRIVLDGQVYRWTNFEELANFIQYSIRAGVTSVQIIPDRDPRLNYLDVAAPVAIYCEPGNLISVYDIGADGQGTLAFSASLLGIWGGNGAAGLGNSLVVLSQTQVQVVAPALDGSLYSFTFDPNVCAVA